MDNMKSRATFSFKGVQVEIESETLKQWMSTRVEGPLEINPGNAEQAVALFDLLSNDLDAKTVSLLEQMGARQFATLFEVHED
jgi:hypothetical protein